MSKFKHAALAMAAASLMAGQVQATEVQAQSPQAVPVATFSQADISTMFEQAGMPMQLAALSGQEMNETEGAVIWFAPVAWAGARYALTGFTRHGINQVISRNAVGVSNQAILNTLRNPLSGSQSFISGANANTTRFIGTNATVNLNRSGQVTSAWARNSAGWR
jgi:hypothetical protein